MVKLEQNQLSANNFQVARRRRRRRVAVASPSRRRRRRRCHSHLVRTLLLK